jgi:hypothetical protein
MYGEISRWRSLDAYVVTMPATKDGAEAAIVQMRWIQAKGYSVLYCHYCESENCPDVGLVKQFRAAAFIDDSDTEGR